MAHVHVWNLCPSSVMHPSLPPPSLYAGANVQGITELGPKFHHCSVNSVSCFKLLWCSPVQQRVVPCPLRMTPRCAYYLTLCVEPTMYVEQMANPKESLQRERQCVAACVSAAAGLSRLHRVLGLSAVVSARAGALCCHQRLIKLMGRGGTIVLECKSQICAISV